MALFKKLIDIGTKILDGLDDSYVQPIPDYTNLHSICTSCQLANVVKKIDCGIHQDIEFFVVNNKKSIFDGIVGYEQIKREFAKALNASSPVSILLCGPPGCGKSEFLRKIRAAYPDSSEFVDRRAKGT